MEMSANPFFQPPPESTGARTIYTVLNAQNASDSIDACYYPSYSNYSFYDQNDCFDYDHYDHDFHAFIVNSPVPSEPSVNGFNSFNSFPSFPSGSGSSHASSRSDSLYKSPNFSPRSKHSRTPSSSSSSSFSSTTPSLTSSSQFSPSSSPSLFMADNDTDSDNCSYEEDGDMLFDATDKAQLDAFVPPQLGAAIDAAKFSSFGKFGNEICWEALPPAFDLGRGQEDKEGKKGAYGQTVQIDWQPFDSFPNFPMMEAAMEPVLPPPPPPPPTSSASTKSLASEFPPLSELSPEQQEKLCAFLYKHRDCVASIEQIREIADQTNLTTIAIVYYLCFY